MKKGLGESVSVPTNQHPMTLLKSGADPHDNIFKLIGGGGYKAERL
jgi:hypothetical protein